MAKANKKENKQVKKNTSPEEPMTKVKVAGENVTPKTAEEVKPKRRKQQTVRERSQTSPKKRRIRTTAGKIKAPARKVSAVGKREYHVVPLPDNKVGRILGKRGRLVPKFISEAVSEVRQVTWPGPKDTVRLTIAVFVFAVVFAAVVGVIDFGLDKLFKEVIIKQ